MIKIMHGNSLEVLKTLEDESIDCVVTSPPYWQIRDYGVSGQIGLESDVNEFLEKLIDVFDEIYRVLKKTGTLFVNMGDTYSNVNAKVAGGTNNKRHGKDNGYKTVPRKTNIKRKSKMMIPERLAIKMIESGWILRNEIIWHKPNILPESVNDRFTNDFEKVFFFSKEQKYYFKKQYEPYSDKTIHALKNAIIRDYKIDLKKEKEMTFSTGFDFCIGSYLAKELGIENMISILGADDWKVKDNDGNYRGQFGTLKRNTKLYKLFKQILGDLEYDFTKDNLSRILRGVSRYTEIGKYLYAIGEEEKISKDIIECGERMKMSEFYKLLEIFRGNLKR